MSDKPRDDFDDDFDDSDADQGDSDQEMARPAKAAGSGSRPGKGPRGGLGRNDAATAGSGGGPTEGAIHVTDRASKVFVLAAVAVFVLILFNGLLLGVGGTLTPIPTPAPVVTAAPTPKPSITAKPSASTAASVAPSASAAASAAPSAAASTAPSTAPSPSK